MRTKMILSGLQVYPLNLSIPFDVALLEYPTQWRKVRYAKNIKN